MNDDRPSVLLVTRNFPPLLGGMEKLNRHLLDALVVRWDVGLCGPRGCAQYAPLATQTSECEIRPLPKFMLEVLLRSLGLARRLRPQWVIAGSGLTAPIAWIVARFFGARSVVYLHGLDIVAPSRIYQVLWLPFIRAAYLVLANSENTAALARQRRIKSERIAVLHPGTNLPALDPKAGREFRERFNLGSRPILLSVGRLTRRKGLAEFVANSLPGILAKCPDAIFVIIGDEASDALNHRTQSERKRILAAANSADVQHHMLFLGRCDECTLSTAYQAAQVHVFPVRDEPGDVEGFGMVAIEAAAHGLPTVAFRVGGVADAVIECRTGNLVVPEDYPAFARTVVRQLSQRGGPRTASDCVDAAAAFSWENFGMRLRDLLTHKAGRGAG